MDQDRDIFSALHLQPHDIFSQVQRESQAGTWLYACDTGRYWWSDQVYQIYGLPRTTPLEADLFLRQMEAEDQPQARDAFAAVLEGQPYHLVHRIRVKGKVKWLEQRGRLHRGKPGAAPYVLGTVRDVTDFKQRDQQLEAKQANFAAITDYLAETTDTTDLSAIVSSVKRTIRKRMDVLIIAVFARRGDQIVRVIPQVMDPMQAFLFQDVQEFVGYRSVQTGKRQVCPAADYPSALGRATLEEMGGQCVTALPIRHGRITIGALSLVTRHPGALTREENEFCRTICGYLANQLYNALLYERLKQELALRTRLESDREVIFNESVDFIAIIEADGRFSQINPAFAARLGSAPETLVGRLVFDFIHPEDRDYAWNVFLSLPDKGLVRGFHTRFLCGDGQVCHFENNLKYTAESRSIIAIARDMTGQREMEARNALLEQTVAFERSKSAFFTGLSHEFKTPLNIILTTLNLIELKSIQEDEDRFHRDYQRFFSYAYQNCYKLLRLSTNLLDASRLENSLYRLHLTTNCLDNLLRRITETAGAYVAARGLSLDYQGTQAPPLAFDATSVARIVLNLLSNAVKNSRSGGRIHLSLTQAADMLQVTVADEGMGIPPKELPHIFDKFMSSHHTAAGLREGSGLGLSLVRSLVELHGGTVTVESQVEQGTQVSFTLPTGLRPATERGPFTDGDLSALARLELSDVS